MPGFSSVFGLTNADKNINNGIAGLDGAGKIPINRLYNLAASTGTIVYHAHDSAVFTAELNYTKLKTITLGFLPANTMRIYFQMKSRSLGVAVYGRVYKNGAAVGTAQSTTSTGWGAFVENIAGWAEGDTIELWASTSDALVIVDLQQFRILVSIDATLVNT